MDFLDPIGNLYILLKFLDLTEDFKGFPGSDTEFQGVYWIRRDKYIFCYFPRSKREFEGISRVGPTMNLMGFLDPTENLVNFEVIPGSDRTFEGISWIRRGIQ